VDSLNRSAVFHTNNNNGQIAEKKANQIKVFQHFVPFLGLPLENVVPVANCLTVDNLYKVSAAVGFLSMFSCIAEVCFKGGKRRGRKAGWPLFCSQVFALLLS